MKVQRILILVLMLSGCTTTLWEPPRYEERIKGYFAAEGQDILLVIGEKYSYVFDSNAQLRDALKVSRRIEFFPRYANFKIDEQNVITGQLVLINRSPEDQQTLLDAGYKQDQYGKVDLRFDLRGKRYEVEGTYPFEMLEDEHIVMIEMPESGLALAGKIVVTPVAVAVDALAVIPLGAFFAVLGAMNAMDL